MFKFVAAWRYKLINLLAGKFLAKKEAVSSGIDDVFPYLLSIEDYLPHPVSPKIMDKLAKYGTVALSPGVYDFYLHSFCLDTGKYCPSSDSVYLAAPLKGKQSKIIKEILNNSLKNHGITQQEIQALIWAITSGIKYEDMSHNLQLIAGQLLAKEDLKQLRKSFWNKMPQPVKDWFFREFKKRLPSEILRVWNTADKIKNKITDTRTTYKELEKAAMRFGKLKKSKDIKIGTWGLTSEGYFMRVFPNGYSRTRIQIYIPEPYEYYSTLDKSGRVTKLGVKGGIEITASYHDNDEMILSDGKTIPVWYFKKLKIQGIDPKTNKKRSFEVNDTGWIAKDIKELASLSLQKYPEISERIRSAQIIYHDKQMLDNSLSENGNSAGDIAELEHYYDGAQAATDIKKRGEWLVEHFRRVINAFLHTISKLKKMTNDTDDEIKFTPPNNIGLPVNKKHQPVGFWWM